MPRLTFRDYCTRRTLLTVLYEQHDGAFIRLSATDQRALHDYYVPSLDLAPHELKAHRRAITKRQPSLPQRAGRAWAKLESFVPTVTPTLLMLGRARHKPHPVARGVLRPKPDYDKFARALLLFISERCS